MNAVRTLSFLFLTVLVCGCGGPPAPTTYPVQGKVTYKDGAPVANGYVQFQSETDTTVTTVGEIQSDGTYTLRTIKGKQRVPGATAGPYRVTVTPPGGEDQSVEPVLLPNVYTVEARENQFNFVIDKPRR